MNRPLLDSGIPHTAGAIDSAIRMSPRIGNELAAQPKKPLFSREFPRYKLSLGM
jgi:hypothetical protein